MKTISKLFLASFFAIVSTFAFAQSADETAIKSLVEKETQAFMDRDAPTMLACNSNNSYWMQLVAESGNVHYSTNSKMDLEKSTKMLLEQMGKPTGETFSNIGYVMHINGTSAFVYFDQVVTATNGVKNKFHEVRYLEKNKGQWKIGYIGAVKFE